MSGSRDEMPRDLRETVPEEDQPEQLPESDDEDSDTSRGPISNAVRSVRGSVRESRARRETKKLKKKRKRQERREKVSEFLNPLTNEIDETRNELSALADEFQSEKDSSEQKEEAGGSFLTALLGAPAQKGDFDGDGDDDLALIFGADNESTGNDGPDPFGSIRDFEQENVAGGGGATVPNVDAQVSQPIADYQSIFDPVSDPLGDQRQRQSQSQSQSQESSESEEFTPTERFLRGDPSVSRDEADFSDDVAQAIDEQRKAVEKQREMGAFDDFGGSR
jgi:hypothetical protein